VSRRLGRRALCLGAGAIGLAALLTGLGNGAAPRTFASLIASWIFFTGAAAGALAFRAFFDLVDAGWARRIAPVAAAPLGFAPVALIVLTVIVTATRLAPWLGPDAGSVWLGAAFLAARQLTLTAALFGLAALAGRRDPEKRSQGLAVAYLVAFAVVGSMWAFDFVLAPDPALQSTIIGPFVFVGAFLAGTGVAALGGLTRGRLNAGDRRDLGALMLALSIFWAYLFWSQLLTIWYGNLPDEVEFAQRRIVDGWGALLLVAVALVFVVPFFGLVVPRARGSARLLPALVVVQLIGLWLTCHLLVGPSLALPGAPPLGARDLLICLGMLGVFVETSSVRALRPGVDRT
jgi:hypothetical protein